jgi:hypothetical protein
MVNRPAISSWIESSCPMAPSLDVAKANGGVFARDQNQPFGYFFYSLVRWHIERSAVDEPKWLMRAGDKVLSAQFKQDNGSTRPGVMWTVQLKKEDSEKVYVVVVKVFFVENEIRPTKQQQAQGAMEYLNTLLARGWTPEKEMDHSIVVGNPNADRFKLR